MTSTFETESSDQPGAGADRPESPSSAPHPPVRRRWWTRRWIRLLIAAVLVVALVLIAVSLFTGTVNSQREGDPRSNTSGGMAALAQLVQDEGVDLDTVTSVSQVVDRSDPTTTVVVTNAENLSAEDASALLGAQRGRLVLIRPEQTALDLLGIAATESPGEADLVHPECTDGTATRAGTLGFPNWADGYAADGAEISCYPVGEGFAYLRVPARGGSADIVAGGLSNDSLGLEGNAAFGMGVLGSQPELLWLMAEREDDTPVGTTTGPGLLPDWWTIAVAQACIAVVVMAIWRGRRLGPILSERLPVAVRASETVEGHGRLYERLEARDQAAAALRRRTRHRLALSFGHADDHESLAQVVSDRTGRDLGQVRFLLGDGPDGLGRVPADDDELITLAQHLDELEQEARQP